MKRSAIIGGWLVATAFAVGIGIGAVNLAGAQVTDDPIQALSADEVPTKPSSPQVTAAASTPPSTTADLQSTTVSETVSTTTVSGSVTTPPTTSPPAGTRTTPAALPETSSTTSPAPSPANPTTSPPQSQVTVYQLVGGSVAIESSPDVVILVWATPNAGFSVEVDSAGPNEVHVDFKMDSHKSKFTAKWSDGLLDIKQKEEAED